jgi:hypothetical protein
MIIRENKKPRAKTSVITCIPTAYSDYPETRSVPAPILAVPIVVVAIHDGTDAYRTVYTPNHTGRIHRWDVVVE